MAADVLGVLDELNLADFADDMGVLCPSLCPVPLEPILCGVGRAAGMAESGSKMSSMTLSPTLISEGFFLLWGLIWSLGILINVAGVAGSLLSAVI
jgi:hypothetical protein